MNTKDNEKYNPGQEQEPDSAAREAAGTADDIEVADVDTQESPEEESEESEIIRLGKELEEAKAATEHEKKEYLFLMAEFDNFRKRTLKEKSEIIKNAGEQVLKGLLPILDDFERGIESAGKSENAESIKEGMVLIYNKFRKYLEQNGVKEIDMTDSTFDTEKHEAISVVPVTDDAMKGKILDTVQKGYMINNKVLRHAKVVVGQ